MSLITSVSGVLVDAESKDDEETFEDSKDNLDDIMAMIEDAREGIIGAVAEGEALLSETTRKPKRKHDDATTFTGGSNQLALLFPDGPTSLKKVCELSRRNVPRSTCVNRSKTS